MKAVAFASLLGVLVLVLALQKGDMVRSDRSEVMSIQHVQWEGWRAKTPLVRRLPSLQSLKWSLEWRRPLRQQSSCSVMYISKVLM